MTRIKDKSVSQLLKYLLTHSSALDSANVKLDFRNQIAFAECGRPVNHLKDVEFVLEREKWCCRMVTACGGKQQTDRRSEQASLCSLQLQADWCAPACDPAVMGMEWPLLLWLHCHWPWMHVVPLVVLLTWSKPAEVKCGVQRCEMCGTKGRDLEALAQSGVFFSLNICFWVLCFDYCVAWTAWKLHLLLNCHCFRPAVKALSKW